MYVVATPLGNLYDMSFRALAVLDAVAGIAAEDTRVSAKLLAHWGIRTPLVAVHAHNERAAAEVLIERLRAGESWALITDAGTPAVSDPGARLVAAVRTAGFAVVPIPGPSAVAAAVSVSGLCEEGFCFRGFLPSKANAREAALRAALAGDLPSVWFEAPHRIAAALAALEEICGKEYPLFVAREMTKRFEEYFAGTVGEAQGWLAARAERQQGEFVLVVPPRRDEAAAWAEAQRWCGEFCAAGVRLPQAVRWAAEIAGVSRKALYAWALTQKWDNPAIETESEKS